MVGKTELLLSVTINEINLRQELQKGENLIITTQDPLQVWESRLFVRPLPVLL